MRGRRLRRIPRLTCAHFCPHAHAHHHFTPPAPLYSIPPCTPSFHTCAPASHLSCAPPSHRECCGAAWLLAAARDLSLRPTRWRSKLSHCFTPPSSSILKDARSLKRSQVDLGEGLAAVLRGCLRLRALGLGAAEKEAAAAKASLASAAEPLAGHPRCPRVC